MERLEADYEYRPPTPDELSQETRRTKEKRGAEPGEFLSIENIPNWLSDIGQERNGDSPLEEVLKVFREFPAEVQRDIVRQIEFERQKKALDKDEILKRLTFLVNRNDDVIKRGAELKKVGGRIFAGRKSAGSGPDFGKKEVETTSAMAGTSPRDRDVEKTKQNIYGPGRKGSRKNFGRKPKYKDKR